MAQSHACPAVGLYPLVVKACFLNVVALAKEMLKKKVFIPQTRLRRFLVTRLSSTFAKCKEKKKNL